MKITVQVQMLKRNIGQFSGFVWSEQEVTPSRRYLVPGMCMMISLVSENGIFSRKRSKEQEQRRSLRNVSKKS